MVEINNLTQTAVDVCLVKKIIGLILEKEGFGSNALISLALVGPGRMKKINKTYRKKNKTTDVLAFAEHKASLGKYKLGRLEKIQGIGEIIICPREVKKNVKRLKTNFKQEFFKVLIHGVLHLLGYDHEQSGKKAVEMAEKEEKYFKAILSFL